MPLHTDCGGFCAIDSIQCAKVILTMVLRGSGLAGSIASLPLMGVVAPAAIAASAFSILSNADWVVLSTLFSMCPAT